MNIHRFPILLTWIICQQIWVVCGCSSHCTSIDPGTSEFECSGETINACKTFSPSWKVNRLSWDQLHLSNCTTGPQAGDQLLLFVSSGKLVNYGKYKIVTVKLVNSTRAKKGLCHVTLDQPIGMFPVVKDQHTCLIAQIFPSFGKVSLRNKCVLTCDEQKDGLGGILAFKAKTLFIDQTSKVDMSGKGFHGGTGGDIQGGGGLGGETFFCPAKEPNMGKGGDISGASWAKNTNGTGGGGGGDGPGTRKGSKGGPGGYNAGGGGADSTANSDDGAGGGGGGGHFSGGGGGGGGSGCGGKHGVKGGKAGKIGTNAGGGGQSSCPGGNGGDGGKPGSYPRNKAPDCYDRSAEGGNAGSASHGGGGGDSCGNHYGGGGGGGGLQFGNMDFGSRLSYGGGGGGGGGSAFSVPGGRGGNGGGLVYLQVDELTLDGEILAKGQAGQCLSKQAHRSAPGGSGAGGSVVILTRKLNGNPSRKIFISGGDPVKCAFGAGGGGGGGVGRWVVKEGRTVHQG